MKQNLSRWSKFKNGVIERLNRTLYTSRKPVLAVASWVSFVASITAAALITYAYGFDHNSEQLLYIFRWLDVVFALFVGLYFVRFLYAFRRSDFLFRENRLEGALMAFIIINGISNYFFQNALLDNLFRNSGFLSYMAFYQSFVAVFMLLLVGYKITRASTAIAALKLKPATTFILSFLLLIGIGTALLMLPTMTVPKGPMPMLEALFTAVSASCVTGLIVVDTATYFTFKGQAVIMLLMQLGGIGIVSFATFFATFLRQGVGLKQQSMMQDFFSTESLFSTKGLLRQIIAITIAMEAVAFVLIFLTWGEEVPFNSLAQKIWFSAFHAISAFCNAGFSLFTNNLHEPGVKVAYLLHLSIAMAVVVGGLGFSTFQDLFSPKALRDRLANPWKDWKLSTKISVYTAGLLLAFGTLVFWALEYGNTLKGLNTLEAIITAFFHSASCRTAGFNTVDIGSLRTPTQILIMFLMFIGASSGSVAGGIKTSTFYLIMMSVAATIRGRGKLEIGRRYIPNETLFKALSIFFIAATFNIVFIFMLTLTESDMAILPLAFEQVSAFGTVGLSTGITSSLSPIGQGLIIISMFVGRVGTLTFVLALANRQNNTRIFKYPRAHLMVG